MSVYTLSDFLQGFEVPQKFKKIRIDIGLSYCAPNSAMWIDENPDTYVIGIEPNIHAIRKIQSDGLRAYQKNITLKYPNENFYLLNLALDNVSEITTKKLYHTSQDVGMSSLLEPSELISNQVKEVIDVTVCSFYHILKKIDWDRFQHVELVKIDTQGKDLDIIKSAGNLLEKIVYLNCEINTFNYYKNNPKPNEFDSLLIENNFIPILDNSFVDGEVVDRTYLNKKFEHLKNNINYFVL
jgi:hypothetical protein